MGFHRRDYERLALTKNIPDVCGLVYMAESKATLSHSIDQHFPILHTIVSQVLGGKHISIDLSVPLYNFSQRMSLTNKMCSTHLLVISFISENATLLSVRLLLNCATPSPLIVRQPFVRIKMKASRLKCRFLGRPYHHVDERASFIIFSSTSFDLVDDSNSLTLASNISLCSEIP